MQIDFASYIWSFLVASAAEVMQVGINVRIKVELRVSFLNLFK